MVKILDKKKLHFRYSAEKGYFVLDSEFSNDSLLVRKLVKRQVSIKGSPDCLLLFLSGSPII